MGTVAAVQGRGDGDLAAARAPAQDAFKRVSDEFNRFGSHSGSQKSIEHSRISTPLNVS